jgi:methylated-DNA-[protein]-cysteine S-methyltransferase
MNTRHAVIESPLNELTLVADDDALTGVYFRHHWHRPAEATFGPRIDADSDTLLAEAQRQLTGYAGGLTRKQFLLELEEPSEVKAARLF